MDYTPVRIVGRKDYYPGLFKLVLDRLPGKGLRGELAGKYFFLHVPGVGEKPFAVFSAEEKSIVVKVVGRFTTHLSAMPPGSELFLRGPYGCPFPALENRSVVMVGGGTGIASLLEIGKLLQGKNRLTFLLGGRSSGDLFDLNEFSALGAVGAATNDGSGGRRGFVTELLKDNLRPDAVYVLCGPEPMVEACFKLLVPGTPPDNVWAAIEYPTSCGVGICGKCASPNGSLTCIDGPFLRYPAFQRRGQLNNAGKAQEAHK